MGTGTRLGWLLGLSIIGCARVAPSLPTALPSACTSPPVRLEPSLSGLDTRSIEAISLARSRGAVVVSYDPGPCTPRFEVLTECTVPVPYAFEPWLAEGVTTGTYTMGTGMSFARADLVGRCDRATHVLSRIEVDRELPLRAVLTPLTLARGTLAQAEEVRLAALQQLTQASTLRQRSFGARGNDRSSLLREALDSYQGADRGWSRYIDLRVASPGDEAWFQLALSRHGVVMTRAALAEQDSRTEVLPELGPQCHRNACAAIRPRLPCHDRVVESKPRGCQAQACARTLTGAELESALQPALSVRDNPDSSRYRLEAARLAIELARRFAEEQEWEFAVSRGARGAARPSTLSIKRSGEELKVLELPIPETWSRLIAMLDSYESTASSVGEEQGFRSKFAFESASIFYAYGCFDDARIRYEKVFERECSKSESGYEAWERLLTISNFKGDIERLRELALTASRRPVAMTAEQRIRLHNLTQPTWEAPYLTARRALQEAQGMPDGPQRDEAWRRTGALFREALSAAPDRDEAGQGGLDGAHAYSQVNDYEAAIEALELMLTHHADAGILAELARAASSGDDRARTEYALRMRFAAQGMSELARLHRIMGDENAAENVERCRAELKR